MKQLLERGVDVEAKDREARTALHIAASKAYKDILRLLLDNGANIEAKDRFGQTVLHAAARVDAAELLLDKGADIEVKDDAGKIALEMAVSKPNTAVVRLLISRGATQL